MFLNLKFFKKISLILCLLFSIASYADIPKDLIKKAQVEGRVNSVGMPDSWANWVTTWGDLKSKYNINHRDTDMNSSQELMKFQTEKRNATADIGDVGVDFAELAHKMKITQPYKPTTWDQIPAWAKDKEGYWVLSYTGTIAFIINKKLVKHIPHSFHDLLKGSYRISIGDVGTSNEATMSLLAAAYAMGGDENNIMPAFNLFKEIAKQGRLAPNQPVMSTLESGEVEVGITWDFNALNYRHNIDPEMFDVLIPTDGSVTSGYSTIINKYAKHPNAAKLTREFILSDQGQINLANGFARPIRVDHIKLPPETEAKLLPRSEYVVAKQIKDSKGWDKKQTEIPALWQSEVLYNLD